MFAVFAADAAERDDETVVESRPDQALVYVTRTQMRGAPPRAGVERTAFIYADEELFGTLELKTHTSKHLPPGEHTIFVAYHGAGGTGKFVPAKVANMKERGQTLTLQAGQTYYLNARGFRLFLLDQAKGEKQINKLPRVKPTDKERQRAAEALAELKAHRG